MNDDTSKPGTAGFLDTDDVDRHGPPSRPATRPTSPDRHSYRSTTSVASTVRRKQQLAELELAAARKKAQIERELIEKELELQKAALDIDDDAADNESSYRASARNNEPQPTTSTMKEVNLSYFLARQSSIKELPPFSGFPEEWPLFYSQYKATTRLCGYSDDENIARLSKCLKGKARDAVSALLLSATNIDKILDTLKLRFGRPEYIVEILLLKIRNFRDIRHDDFNSVIEFATCVQNVVATMISTEETGHLNNPTLIKEIIGKLPSTLKINWGFHVENNNIKVLSLTELSEWLMKVAYATTHVAPIVPASKHTEKQIDRQIRPLERRSVLATSTSGRKCSDCKGDHDLGVCPSFLARSIDDRWKFVTDSRLCFSCLSSTHQLKDCKKKRRCQQPDCLRYHHELLHALPITNMTVTKTMTTAESSKSVNTCGKAKTAILLKVVPVTIYGPSCEVKVLALLDEGAGMSLVDESVCARAGITGPHSPLRIHGATGMMSTECDSRVVSFKLKGQTANFFKLNNVHSVSNLNLPFYNVNFDNLVKEYQFLYDFVKDMDVGLYNKRPLLLIGSDNLDMIVTRKVYQGPKHGPIISETKLGHVVHGKLSSITPTDIQIYHLCACEELTDAVKRFYSTEAFGCKLSPSPTPRSREDMRAVAIMESTTKLLPSGRWETGLLWKDDIPKLPDSYSHARSRLTGIERKLKRCPELKTQFQNKIVDNVTLGYFSKLSCDEVCVKTNKTWYVPIFPVFNPNKPNKIRLVMDFAAKSEGRSLNDFLLTGPDFLTSLPGVLLGFRSRRIAIMGDIEAMFHRIFIREEDRQAQRFLWENDEYVLNVMSFGAVCSPSCAQYVKNLNARRFESTHPQAVDAIVEHHYVDDFIYSVGSNVEAKRVMDDVIMIHAAGGFNLTNFLSNSKSVLQHLPTEKLTACGVKLISDVNDNLTERVLGLNWDPDEDCFTFSLKLTKLDEDLKNGVKRPTKRETLKLIMSIFDPLGFLIYATINVRILMQDIWKSQTGWDDEIGTMHFERWQRWLTELQKLRNVKIPRWLSTDECIEEQPADIHVFCDASSRAFASVAYLRRQMFNGSYHVSLIISRARVAPLKAMSVPRLELQAAVMGARLSQVAKKYIDCAISRIYYWTDSKTVLAWLRSETGRFKPFVAHRVSEISELTPVCDWRWVPTNINPADYATRETVTEDNTHWLKGPDFLRGPEGSWPIESERISLDPNDVEVKLVCVVTEDLNHSLPDDTRFSSYWRLVRSTAWVLRFVHNLRQKTDAYRGELLVNEIQSAECHLFKQSQRRFYSAEINATAKSMPIDKNSSLRQLSPFLDSRGLLRVGGRISLASVDDDTKHPIILNPKDNVVRLLIHQYHVDSAHVGRELVHNNLRQKYWIVHGRSAVKRAFFNCQYCKNRRAKPAAPLMGQLPDIRLTPKHRAFTFTGLDYFGPMTVKVGRRHEKRYGALFTCLTVRAIHIELVHDLSTSGVLLAIRRFVARRGCPEQIWSDNGTAFRGADKELRLSVQAIDKDELTRWGSIRQVKWNFIAPNAPHMGGCWERLIRSVKTALKFTLKERAPNDQTLQTLLTETEFTVNSRPLTYVSIDSNDDLPLTPNDFLLQNTHSLDYPFGNFTDRDLLKRSWRESQRLSDMLWKRWIREYLPTLTRPDKWLRPVDPLSVGDVVIIADPDHARNLWPKGVVVNTYPGKDGQVRVVDVQTNVGIYKRPVHKLCKLDVRNPV